MKNSNKKAAAAAMMCMAMAVPFGAVAENETRVITAGTLNLRAEANTDSDASRTAVQLHLLPSPR